MEKHSCDIKETIEYKVYSNRFKLMLSISLIYFTVVIGSIVALFCSVPLAYEFQFFLESCVVKLTIILILI